MGLPWVRAASVMLALCLHARRPAFGAEGQDDLIEKEQ